jgi:predicted nuclease of predicted toxin-antitoxin system
MKLLVDMNLSPRWIGLLHNAGWEAEIGQRSVKPMQPIRKS